MDRLPSVTVAALLLLAGCSGLAGPTDEPRTVNPNLDSTPSATATSPPGADYPPGVSADGVDAGRLATAHADALENRSKAVRAHITILAANGTTLLSRTTTTRTDGDALSVSVQVVGAQPGFLGPFLDYGFWSDGNATLVRRERPDGTVRYRERPGDARPTIGVSPTGRAIVEPLLYSAAFQYVGTERRGNATYHVLTAGTVEFGRTENARNVRVAIAVTPEGVVESTSLRYDTRLRGVEVTIVERFRVFDVGSTTVERPGWADEAANGTTTARNVTTAGTD